MGGAKFSVQQEWTRDATSQKQKPTGDEGRRLKGDNRGIESVSFGSGSLSNISTGT